MLMKKKKHYWYYYIFGTIQSEDLMQVISLHYSVRYYLINSLIITINGAPKYGNMFETTKGPNHY